MKVASSPPATAAAAPYWAARRAGEPRVAKTVSATAAPPNGPIAQSHADGVGLELPPRGSAATRNTARLMQVRLAAPHAAGRTR